MIMPVLCGLETLCFHQVGTVRHDGIPNGNEPTPMRNPLAGEPCTANRARGSEGCKQ